MFVGVVFPFMAMIFDDFLSASGAALGLLESPEVAARWEEPSACEGFTVGGMAAHLGWQVQSARLAVEAPRPEAGAAVTDLTGHYGQAAWLGADLDAPVNAGIRDAGQERAQSGPAEQARLTREAREALGKAFVALDPQEVIAVPWIAGRAMTAHDVLATRVLELVIHTDDLAVSVGVPTPLASDAAYERVVGILAGVSMRRFGPLPLLRALSRAERAPESVAVF
jgi:uncharacterized protein (TIGR03083 family)